MLLVPVVDEEVAAPAGAVVVEDEFLSRELNLVVRGGIDGVAVEVAVVVVVVVVADAVVVVVAVVPDEVSYGLDDVADEENPPPPRRFVDSRVLDKLFELPIFLRRLLRLRDRLLLAKQRGGRWNMLYAEEDDGMQLKGIMGN